MAFKRLPGIQGKIYVPASTPDAPRKHACPDCFFCQQCSDDRCQACLGKESKPELSRQGKGTCCCLNDLYKGAS